MPTYEAWRRRSKANIDAAGELLRGTSFPGPAASRSYYGLFQAVVAEHVKQGRAPKDVCGEARWRHAGIEQNLRMVQRLSLDSNVYHEARKIFKRLLDRRTVADYGPGHINLDDARRDHAELVTFIQKRLP